jgi:hypothetical protein
MTSRIFLFGTVAAILLASRGAGRPIPAPVVQPTGDAWRTLEARIIADVRATVSTFALDGRPPGPPMINREVEYSLLRTPNLKYEYRGDGRFSDGGDRAAYDRYVLDLGAVRFDVPGRYEYRCAGFPPIRFTFGFDIQAAGVIVDPIYEKAAIRARVRLRVVRTEGDVVMDEDDRLDKWIWSGSSVVPRQSFVYRQGRSEGIRAGDGREKSINVGMSTDEGWGTYFKPREAQAYRVTVEVLTTDPDAAGFEVRLKAAGGGWKS